MWAIWCADDPVIRINGEEVSIEISVRGAPETVRASVRSAETTIILPLGVDAETVATTDEFFSETVRYVRSAAAERVGIEVRFDASRNLPVAVRVNGWVMAEGSTFGTLTMEIPVAQYA